MVIQRQGVDPLKTVCQAVTREQLLDMQETVAATYVSEPVVEYIVNLVSATRNNSGILRGASPRATLSVTAMAKTVARMRGRDYVLPEDVSEVFIDTIAHRLELHPGLDGSIVRARQVLDEIRRTVRAPRLR